MPNLACRGATPEEIPALLPRIEAGFADTPDQARPQRFTRFLAIEPPPSADHMRVALVDDEPVAACIVVPHLLRIGRTHLLAGGFTGVTTFHGHRHQGHAARLMRDANAFLASRGYDLGTLQAGVPELYRKVGYAFTYTGGHHGEIRDLPALARLPVTCDYEFRLHLSSELTPAEFTAICDLHDRGPQATAAPFHVYRSRRRLAALHQYEQATYYLLYRAGQVVACGTLKIDAREGVVEVLDNRSWDDRPAVFLHAWQRVIEEAGAPRALRVTYHPAVPSLRAALERAGARLEFRMVSPHMATLLAPDLLLRKFLPTWNARLQRHDADVGSFRLVLSLAGGAARVVLRGGHNILTLLPDSATGLVPDTREAGAYSLHLKPETLAQLVFGVTGPRDLLEDLPAWQESSFRRLCSVLFPPTYPAWPSTHPY